MKQIGNLSVYKLLGYVILGIGAIAFVNASTGKIQANAPVPVPETSSQYSRSRHTINLVLNELDDLKRYVSLDSDRRRSRGVASTFSAHSFARVRTVFVIITAYFW